ncbi:MAG: hypothetical protein DI565_03520 [Ancylobacter novellus]|uniref:Uncharacterized protein n=1 Tax=Ancylobacter novellus TaxID=921 RepID=A0A2W5KQX3_ANCNO|nr:MAG: hypothetical protein DI565_03520 [Ancylobacter novellus]
MFYVYELSKSAKDEPIKLGSVDGQYFSAADETNPSEDNSGRDIDFVDDSLLNTAPHNAIEQQLLRGDMIGLALMSGAILWSAMGAFG